MRFGLVIPPRGPLATVEGVCALAARAEQHGFAHMAVPDHIVVPRRIDSRYPYSESGEFPGAAAGDCLEPFTLIAYLAAITTHSRLLTSVAVVPHRAAVHTAKIVATIDFLTGGRMTLGIGAGWMREEFEALGAPPFEERGRVTDEYLEAFKVLWTEEDPRFEGRHVRFADIAFLPKPVQQPRPPIWVGGESRPAMRRVVRHGDVWYPIGANPRHPLDTHERYADAVARLHRLAEDEGRDPASIGLAYFDNAFDERKTATTDHGERRLLSGSTEQIAGDIRALAEIGTTDLVLNFARGSLEETLESADRFASEIAPLTDAGRGT